MIKRKKTDNLNREERIIRRRNELAKKEKVAAIWTRVSSADQYKNNNSIPTQIAACEDYCARNGIRVKRRLRTEGLEISKQKLSQCLRNCFYCGLIEHEYLNGNRIEGCQEPLITKAMYWKVQDILNGNTSNYRHTKETPKFPLKGYLKSNKDGRIMTGYTVKKKHLDYYKSNGKGCNVSAKAVHAQFVEILNSLSVSDEFKPLFEMVIRQKFTEKEGEFADRAQSVSKNLNALKSKLKTAKTRYVTENCISEEDYNEVKADLEQKISECEQYIGTMKTGLLEPKT